MPTAIDGCQIYTFSFDFGILKYFVQESHRLSFVYASKCDIIRISITVLLFH